MLRKSLSFFLKLLIGTLLTIISIFQRQQRSWTIEAINNNINIIANNNDQSITEDHKHPIQENRISNSRILLVSPILVQPSTHKRLSDLSSTKRHPRRRLIRLAILPNILIGRRLLRIGRRDNRPRSTLIRRTPADASSQIYIPDSGHRSRWTNLGPCQLNRVSTQRRSGRTRWSEQRGTAYRLFPIGSNYESVLLSEQCCHIYD